MGDARYQDYLGNQTWVADGVVISNGIAPQYDVDGNITNYAEMEFAKNTKATFLQDYISRYYSFEEANLMSRTFAKLREVTIEDRRLARLIRECSELPGYEVFRYRDDDGKTYPLDSSEVPP